MGGLRGLLLNCPRLCPHPAVSQSDKAQTPSVPHYHVVPIQRPLSLHSPITVKFGEVISFVQKPFFFFFQTPDWDLISCLFMWSSVYKVIFFVVVFFCCCCCFVISSVTQFDFTGGRCLKCAVHMYLQYRHGFKMLSHQSTQLILTYVLRTLCIIKNSLSINH